MKIILKNFWITLTRFRVASTLNIIGLSLAFALFTIIFAQLRWEYTYNSDIEEADRIYSMYLVEEGEYWPASRQIIDAAGSSSSEIEIYVICRMPWEVGIGKAGDNSTTVRYDLIEATGDLPDLFSLSSVDGNMADFAGAGNIIIPRSLSRMLFDTISGVGELVYIDGDEARVVAVFEDLPSNTTLSNKVFRNAGELTESIGQWNFSSYFKLREGAHINNAFAAANQAVIDRTEGKDLWLDTSDQRAVFSPLTEAYFSPYEPLGNRTFSNILLLLAIVVVCVALINYLNFFLSLVPTRIRAVNINKVFGAPVSALRANVIVEGGVFMALSFLLSLGFVELASRSFIAELVEAPLSILAILPIVCIGLIVVIIIGIVVALLPAIYITGFAPSLVLKGSFGRSRAGRALRQSLSIVQFAVSFICATSALFIILQTQYLKEYDYGFEGERVIIAQTNGTLRKSAESLKVEVLKNPDIESMSYSTNPVFIRGLTTNVLDFNGADVEFVANFCDADFVKTHGLRIVEGEDFSDNSSTFELLINQTMANQYGLKVGDMLNSSRYKVVGIIADFNAQSLHGALKPFALTHPHKDFAGDYYKFNMSFKVRATSEASISEIEEFLSNTMETFDSDGSFAERDFSLLDSYVRGTYQSEDNISLLLIIFSIVTFIISLMGVFGMVLFDMQYRHREIALRKIYGSTISALFARFNRSVIVTLLVSFVVSVPVTWYAVRGWLEGFTYHIEIEWWVFAVVAVVLSLLVVSIVTLQCYSVVRANPVEALKKE